MAYSTYEKSGFAGKPVELYTFVRGIHSYYFTSGDAEITYLGNTYLPSTTPIRRQAIEVEQSKSSSIDLAVPLDNPVAQLFRIFVPANTMWLTIHRFHRQELAPITFWQGRVIGVAWQNQEATLRCEPLESAMKRQILRRAYGINCQHMLYDHRCTVLAAAYRDVGTVASLSGNAIQASVFASKPDGWWTAGFVRVQNEDYRMVVGHTGDTVSVLLPFEHLGPGDDFETFAGCDRALTTCRTKFSNAINFGGTPWIPLDNPFVIGLAGRSAADDTLRTLSTTESTKTKIVLG